MNRHTRVRRIYINKTKKRNKHKLNLTKQRVTGNNNNNNNNKNKNKYTKKRITGGVIDDLIDKSTKDTEDMIKNARLAGNLTKLSHGVIIGLTLSGVGIPFVGLVGAVFLISNQLIKAKENNLTLKNVLNDVLVIITNNFRLYKVINKSIQIFEKHNTIQPFIIDASVIKILYEKMLYLFENLLEISPTEVITALVNDKSINSNTELKDIIQIEYKNRNSGIKNAFASLNRTFRRNVNSDKTTNRIVKNISIINGYFMIMKTQFDIASDYYQRNLPLETNSKIWKEIEADESFKDFLSPDDDKTGETILEDITDENIDEEEKLNNKLRIIYKKNYY
jgi:hypothetical protein